MNDVLLDYFRCPKVLIEPGPSGGFPGDPGLLKFYHEIIGDGQPAISNSPKRHKIGFVSGKERLQSEQRPLELPFDCTRIVDDLRLERYAKSWGATRIGDNNTTRWLYYCIRPFLPIPVRRILQRVHFRHWQAIPFPRWPVDFTVDSLMEHGMARVLKDRKIERIPFIWFWPDGAPSCAILTHDVEGKKGRDFCTELMDIDESFGIKSAFQIVPEVRYGMINGFLEVLRSRGFEINVHDLNHDGSLFRDRDRFLQWAPKINRYAREFGAAGFRSGAMYRNQDWYDAFDFSYDMSVPNVGHLEPQRGGCCTVMPYFIGRILELPLTTIEDYSLFHILGDYSTDLWKQQINLIMQRNGLVSFITHPDYLIEKRAQSVYLDLLAHLARLRSENKLWITLPAEVNRWWRDRSQMLLVQDGDKWRIEGPDSERARIAYAKLQGDRVIYSVNSESSLL